jgi:hypothetical protein
VPGDWVWDPHIKEITFAYSRYAQANFPRRSGSTGRPQANQACIFGWIVENLDSFAARCKSPPLRGHQAHASDAIELSGWSKGGEDSEQLGPVPRRCDRSPAR